MLEIRDISKSFNGKAVLRKISFSVKEGETVLYMGNNGSGKTTTFKIIAGLLPPDSGKIIYNENEIDKRDIAYLCEERSLYTDCTVKEHAKLIYDLNHLNNFETVFNRWIHILKIEQYRNVRIDKLSKGNRQKVSILMCMIKNPKIVILDEPFTALDQDNIELFKKVIYRLKRDNKIVILSSHQLQNAKDICDRFVYLNDGMIGFSISTDELEKLKQKVVWITLNDNIEIDNSIPHYFQRNTVRYYMKNIRQAKKFIRKIIGEHDFAELGMENLAVMDYKEFCL